MVNRSSYELVPFKAEHAHEMNIQDAQRGYYRTMALRPEHADMLEQIGNAWTALKDGQPIGSAGVLYRHPRSVEAWAIFSCQMSNFACMRFVIKEIRSYLDRHLEISRIQITVRKDFKQGHRFARHFGFEPEGVLSKYDIDGTDHILYAKVR